jgi:GNAT superfamily N-acetyltransferase
VTECLQYPDFSCVVLYKKLIVGFAFLVPNVKYTENYVSFIFTRPGWRNVGIGKFMLYHLIQVIRTTIFPKRYINLLLD